MTKMYVHVLLDRTGSMSPIAGRTVDAYNELCNSLKDDKVDTRVSLTVFDSISTDLIRDSKSPEEAKLKAGEYQPRASTPLLDAMGFTITVIDERSKDYDRVSFVIITDGFENASREHTKASVKALLDVRIKEKKWLVQYLGADQDAIHEAMKYGIASQNSMSFNKGAIGQSMRASARNTRSYAQSGDATQGFTDEERAEAMKDNE